MDNNVEITPEFAAKLKRIIAQNQALGPSIIAPDAPREFKAIKDKPVIAVRTHDTVGRRITTFIELNVSVGLSGTTLAVEIADAMNAASAKADGR